MLLVLLSRVAKLRYMEELLKYLEPYVDEIIRDPSRVKEIVGKLVLSILFVLLLRLITENIEHLIHFSILFWYITLVEALCYQDLFSSDRVI